MRVIITILVSVLLNFQYGFTQTNPQEEVISNPPYLAQSDNFMMVVFNVKAEKIQPFLPQNLTPVINQQGEVSVSLEMYETFKVSGIPNFKMVFMVVEIEGYKSKSGNKGRFPIWGVTNSIEVLNSMKNHYGFPYDYNEKIEFHESGDTQIGDVYFTNGESIHLKIEKDKKQAFDLSGIVNMIGVLPDNKTSTTEIPWHSKGFISKVTELDIHTKNPILKLINEKSSIFTMFSNEQVFSYSVPIVVSH